ncbi:MAG: hypothetical protein ACLFQ8_00595 [Candidatus Aenigmatarchaeota archaeon]
MFEFFDFEHFSWGVVVALFAVIVLLGVTFGFSASLDIEMEKVPLYALLGFTISMALFEGGLIVYLYGANRGAFHSEERRKNLILKLNSVKNAREDVEEGFMKRNMDKESRDEMLRDLKQKELEIKNQLETLQKGELDFDMEGE